LARAEKYRIDFKTRDGYDARIQFLFEGWGGGVTNLTGGTRPFVLQEFNSDEDLWKPIRSQMATIEIIGNVSGVSIDDFLKDKDDDILVIFSYNNVNSAYWYGYLMQDDFQEVWEDTNHILILTAVDGLGYGKDFPLSNNGSEITAKTTPLQLMEYCTQNAAQSWGTHYIFNNLFHDSMTDSATYTGINQCTIDPKTFQIQSTEYENKYSVLEKINRAFNQTLFMYNGNWWVMRLEELYIPPTDNLRGYRNVIGTKTALNTRYDVEVGNAGDVKIIAPSAIRFINRRTKENSVQYSYDPITELITNGTFSRGSLITTTSTLKQYNVNSWDYRVTSGIAPEYYAGSTPSTGSVTRNEIYTNTTFGYLEDNYVRFPTNNAVSSEETFLRSQAITVFSGEKINISFDYKYETDFNDDGFMRQMVVMLDGNTNNYFMDQDGKWHLSNAGLTSNVKYLGISYNTSGDPEPTEWNTVSVESEPLPDNGVIKIAFILDFHTGLDAANEAWIKALQFQIIEPFNQLWGPLKGIKTAFTKTDTLYNKQENELFIHDGFSFNFKGSIYDSAGTSLLDSDWYRYRYNTEQFSFRKQNNIAYWENTRFNRNKLDCNFYGLTYDSGSRIGLHNTVRFLDDDPDKVYAILNMNEIDFANATWNATLLEVWDEAKDGGDVEEKTFDADVTTGTYNTPVNVPWTAVSLADFTISGGYSITYNGITSLNVPITISLAGNINTTSPAPLPPVTTTFTVKQNGSAIKTQTYPVSANPQAFTFNLSPSGNITINPGDTFQIDVSANITQIQYTSGAFTINYDYPGSLTYDPYTETYIYNK
jgi:hypothetical protein